MNAALAEVDQEIREFCHIQPFSGASEWRERRGLRLVPSDWRADYRPPRLTRRDMAPVVAAAEHITVPHHGRTSEAVTALSKEERYRLAADSICGWLAEDDDEDIVILAELEHHLKVNPVGFQE